MQLALGRADGAREVDDHRAELVDRGGALGDDGSPGGYDQVVLVVPAVEALRGRRGPQRRVTFRRPGAAPRAGEGAVADGSQLADDGGLDRALRRRVVAHGGERPVGAAARLAPGWRR